MVERRAYQTVRGTVERLKKDFFSKDPDAIIDIWLFRDGPSYRKYSRELFSYDPGTPYGYYLESEQSLVMNISTGAGTLNHEIVHPFMATNFPNCPPWFNEGLGSLYECSTTREGHIWGLTNWRVTGLKNGIRRKTLPSFEELMSWKVAGWELPSSVCCIIRAETKGKVKEYVYQKQHAAEAKVKSLMAEGADFTVCTDEAIHFVSPESTDVIDFD